MSHIFKKEQLRNQLENDLARHKRARQLSIFEINRIKAATRRMRPNIVPFGPAVRWLEKVPSSCQFSNYNSHNKLKLRNQLRPGLMKNTIPARLSCLNWN